MEDKKESIFSKLMKAKEDIKQANLKAEGIIEDKHKEISLIKEKYESLLDEVNQKINNSYKKIVLYGDEIFNYSRFWTIDICNIVAMLMSYVELETFVVTKSDYTNSIIIKKSVLDKQVLDQYCGLNNNIMHELYSNGDLIYLGVYMLSKIYLYATDGEANYFYGKYGYIKEFLESLVIYRIENQMKDITKEELEKLMYNFLITHKELINKKKEEKGETLTTTVERENLIKIYGDLEKELNSRENQIKLQRK